MLRNLTVARRTPPERRVIGFIRRAAYPDGGSSSPPFKSLTDLALTLEYDIQPPGTPYLGSDEMLLLAYLANRQRERPLRRRAIPPELQRALDDCAMELAHKAVWLPLVAIQRPGFHDAAKA